MTSKKTEYIDRMITIRDDQDAYLKGRRDLNFSGWVQKKIDDELMGKRWEEMTNIWIDAIKKAGDDMLKEEPRKYRFHLSCGAEQFDEEVECLPSQVKSELRDWMKNLVTYFAKPID